MNFRNKFLGGRSFYVCVYYLQFSFLGAYKFPMLWPICWDFLVVITISVLAVIFWILLLLNAFSSYLQFSFLCWL